MKAISIIFSLLLLVFLLGQIDLKDLSAVIQNIRPSFLAAAFIVYIFLNIARTSRYYLLLQKKIKFSELFHISFAHAFINNIMPARIGELSYVYYVGKNKNVGFGSGLGSLFLARAFDALIIALLLLLSLVFIAQKIYGFERVFVLALLCLILILLIFGLFIFWETKIIWLINFAFSIFKLDRFSLGNKILLKLREAISTAGLVRKMGLFIKTAASSVLIWLLVFLINWLVALGFGLKINFWEMIFMSSLPNLVGIIPFYTVANFGIFEGSAALALGILGFNKETAISFSLVLHIVGITLSAIPGVMSYLILSFIKEKT